MSPEHAQELADCVGPQKAPASVAQIQAQTKQASRELLQSQPPAPTHLESLKKKAQALKQELAKVETAIRWTQAMIGEDP